MGKHKRGKAERIVEPVIKESDRALQQRYGLPFAVSINGDMGRALGEYVASKGKGQTGYGSESTTASNLAA